MHRTPVILGQLTGLFFGQKLHLQLNYLLGQFDPFVPFGVNYALQLDDLFERFVQLFVVQFVLLGVQIDFGIFGLGPPFTPFVLIKSDLDPNAAANIPRNVSIVIDLFPFYFFKTTTKLRYRISLPFLHFFTLLCFQYLSSFSRYTLHYTHIRGKHSDPLKSIFHKTELLFFYKTLRLRCTQMLTQNSTVLISVPILT